MCESSLSESQKFPKKEDLLGKNMNIDLAELGDKLKEKQRPVYAYVVATVVEQAGEFCQTGCGPNLQGGRITLCTCKHFMRTWGEIDDWEKTWIAGLTSEKIGGKNYLFYLMQVEKSYHSFKEIWEDLDEEIRLAKNASTNFLGDLYEPYENCIDEFDGSGYCKPAKHVHLKDDIWEKKDIGYRSNCGKRPALLLGSVEQSFLWSKRIIFSEKTLKRATPRWPDLDSFVKNLRPSPY